MTLLISVIPALQVWLAGRLIDEVVEGIAGGGGNEYIRPVVILAIVQLLLFIGGSLFQTLSNISQQLLQERLAIHVQLRSWSTPTPSIWPTSRMPPITISSSRRSENRQIGQ